MSRIVGGANTLSKMPGRFPGYYRTLRGLVRGQGARVRDANGVWYVDWSCALGAVSLGYHDPEVDAAVLSQVRDDGPVFSLPDEVLEETTAELLCGLVPCAEAVRFVQTGSEAAEAAVRVARAHTGRDLILMPDTSYHSWHSWYAASREHCPGVPHAMRGLVRTFKYNDLGSLDRLLDSDLTVSGTNLPLGLTVSNRTSAIGLADHVAAVVLEPTLYEPPAPGFLAGLRERCDRIGALLVFDEVVTGFRWHAGGYQTICGVTPDLATFGKGMGNGYPVAALVGREGPMRWARLASGTHGGNCVGLAAARAAMSKYRGWTKCVEDHRLDPPLHRYGADHTRGPCSSPPHDSVTAHMHAFGRRLMRGYNETASRLGAPTRMEGQAPHPRIAWCEDDKVGKPDHARNRWRASLFFQECARRGVLFHPDGVNVTLAHGYSEIQETLRVCEKSMALTCEAIERGDGDVRDRIEGDPISPEPAWRVTT